MSLVSHSHIDFVATACPSSCTHAVHTIALHNINYFLHAQSNSTLAWTYIVQVHGVGQESEGYPDPVIPVLMVQPDFTFKVDFKFMCSVQVR